MTPRTLVTAAFVMTVLVLGLSARASIHAESPSRDPLRGRGHSNRIVVENVHQGTTGWVTPEFRQSRSPRDRRSSPRLRAAAVWNDSTIRGYAGATSYNRDEPIDLHISTSAPSYDVEVHRMGWYGATGARLFLTVTGLPGLDQPVPAPDPITGLIEASWQTTHTLQPGADWISGVYLAKLTASGGATDYVIFVLRDDGAPADLLFQVAVTTYQAYNNWGGKSLYGFNSTGDERANVVSFDRPYERWDGAGGFFDGDYNMIRWLEREGYDVTYVTSLDVQQSPSIFNNRPVFVSNFHDEYWSTPMRDNLVAAQAAGTATPANFALRIDGAVVPASVAQTLSPGSHTVSIDSLVDNGLAPPGLTRARRIALRRYRRRARDAQRGHLRAEQRRDPCTNYWSG